MPHPYPHTRLPTENISHYTSTTILPPIDPQNLPPGPMVGYKSHRNDLSTRYLMPHRTLETMRRVESGGLLVGLGRWKEMYFPTTRILTTPYDQSYPHHHRLHHHDRAPANANAIYDFISLPTLWTPQDRMKYTVWRPVDVEQPRDFQEFLTWTYTYPLRTAQAIFALLFHPYKKWRFVQKHEHHHPHHHPHDSDDHEHGGDDAILRRFEWGNGWGGAEGSMQVFIQPPWVLSDFDLRCFVGRTSFPPYDEDRAGMALDSELRLWAKIWDTCRLTNSHWFVLTNYHGWVFGKISREWTHAETIPIFEFTLSSTSDGSGEPLPSALDWLLYWMASSVGVSGADVLPQISEKPATPASRPPIQHPQHHHPYPNPTHHQAHNALMAPLTETGTRSESPWCVGSPDERETPTPTPTSTLISPSPPIDSHASYVDEWLDTRFVSPPQNACVWGDPLVDRDAPLDLRESEVRLGEIKGEWLEFNGGV